MTVRYAILGDTQARRADGSPAPLGGARLRALHTRFLPTHPAALGLR
ncbi:hypothetical protein ACIQGZ_29500 [Streptomyces sp. NPDC092296]